jgi:hypothetical protein
VQCNVIAGPPDGLQPPARPASELASLLRSSPLLVSPPLQPAADDGMAKSGPRRKPRSTPVRVSG